MLIVREVFTAKPGQASKFAKLFKKAFAGVANMRILTDFVGNYNTVVMETQVSNLAEFEQQMSDYKSANLKLDPQLAEELSKYTDMYLTGRREIFQVVE
jgi:hypothetical protein